MKRIFSSAIIWITIFLSVLVVFLYFFGFRITYAPTLENSWDAISACASWFSAIASVVAILIAIRIPKRIAEQQNTIALFDKRYSAYTAFAFLMSVVKHIANNTVKYKDKKLFFDTVMDTYKSISIVREIASDCKEHSAIYIRLIFEAGKISLLFETDDSEKIIKFLIAADEYIASVYADNPIDDTNLKDAYKQLDTLKIGELLEKQLKLS